ncbi:MAG: hypothetical protein ACREDK_03215 [Thermoplasmata archaeon]
MVSLPSHWSFRALRILTPIIAVVLFLQYVLGLWTSAYAPASGFTGNTSLPSLDWHYNLGFALGVLTLLTVIVAAFTRQVRSIAMSILLFAAVAAAGLAGSRFVSTMPNDPNATIAMGIAFVVALGVNMAFSFRLMQDARAPSTPAMVTPSA